MKKQIQKLKTMGKALLDFGLQMGQQLAGWGMGILAGKQADKRQIAQQRKLQDMEIQGQQRMTDYNMGKQMEMWEKTNYKAQQEQLKKAGLNPGLIYGMGGGGGGTTNIETGGVSGGNAPVGGGEPVAMGLAAANIGLLRAQKDNIEASTNKTKAEERNIIAEAEGKGMENALTAWLQGTTPEGQQAGNLDQSIRGQREVQEVMKGRADTEFRLDENQRQKLKNSAELNKLGEEISILKQKGLSEIEITENLKKEGKLKQAEIEWNALDLGQGNFGKFLTNMIKMLFRPR